MGGRSEMHWRMQSIRSQLCSARRSGKTAPFAYFRQRTGTGSRSDGVYGVSTNRSSWKAVNAKQHVPKNVRAVLEHLCLVEDKVLVVVAVGGLVAEDGLAQL